MHDVTPRSSARAFRVKPRRLGLRHGVELANALRLADELEDAEIVRKLELRKRAQGEVLLSRNPRHGPRN